MAIVAREVVGVDDVGGFLGSVGNDFSLVFLPLFFLFLSIFTYIVVNSCFIIPTSTANAAI